MDEFADALPTTNELIPQKKRTSLWLIIFGILVLLGLGYFTYTQYYRWETYKDTKFNLEMNYPKSWRLAREDKPETIYFMDTKGSLTGAGARLMVSITPESADSLENWIKNQDNPLSTVDAQFNGIAAKELKASIQGPCEKDWAVFRNNTVYRIHRFAGTCSSDKEVSAALASIKIK